MVKKIIISILCFAVAEAYTQQGTISPYSYFGLGEIRSVRTAENQMMGGIAIYGDSIHVNLNNPAAYGNLGVKKAEDFGMTVYTAGITNNRLRLKSATEQENTSFTNLDYLSLAMSLKKGLGIGFGITPYSTVAYNIVSESINKDNAKVTNTFEGTGGVNRVYFSVGYQVLKNLSIGATMNFNFGTIENNRLQTVENVQLGVKDERSSRVNGVDFNYALNYSPKISNKYRLYTSVRVNTQGNFSARNTQRIGSMSTINNQEIQIIDVDLAAQGLSNIGLKIPTSTTLGLGMGQDTKWFLGVEYTQQDFSSFSNDFLDFNNLEYQEASSIAFGGFFVPSSDSFSSYLKRITYRAGAKFQKTGMLVNDTEIDNFGITFGVGLPLSGSYSNLNLGFELGKRGTTTADLIQENYFKVYIGLSLNDLWFRKRKIN